MPLDAETDLRLAELERRVANLLRPGRIEQADYEAARVRVRLGDALTGWLPWLTRRAAADADWWAPEVGEQVLILSPSGEPAQGWVVPAGYSDQYSAPAARETVRRTTYADGTVVEYDREAHRLTVDCSESTATMVATNGEVTATAEGGELTLETSGDVKAQIGGSLDAQISGTAAVEAGGETTIDAPMIRENGGKGVVTGECICHFTGAPHGDISTTVTAGK